MERSLEAMTVAVRVLGALNEKRRPDRADLDLLRHFAPLSAHLPPDELACEVIQQAVKQRTEIRTAARDANGPSA
jgi:hypothetical protein